ncbi:hypothetical protein [Pseudoalteromonas pernae]|uniref:hypothetical protein n=1 Tax=Pseudoalteromonas pernae TaxID=3118054 RepID=UPI003241FD60
MSNKKKLHSVGRKSSIAILTAMDVAGGAASAAPGGSFYPPTFTAEERPDLGDLVFMEFDNVKDKNTGETFDYQVILRSGIDDHENMYEMIFAYDNLGANVDEGTIFVEGGDSTYSTLAGFKDGALANVVGYNDLGKVLKDYLVICFDYVGPEQSEIALSFKATVNPESAGTTKAITMNYSLGGEAAVMSHEIAVNTNLKMADIADMEVDENGRIDGIEVAVLDADQSPNELIVSGENITAEIDGMSFNLIPNAHFHGDTEVTVTVRDKAYTSDSVSKTFLLSVASDGIEYGCTDATATNYDANANTDDGSCQYPVTVTPEPEVEKSSSGSTGIFMLLGLLGLMQVRRSRA